MIYPNFNAAQMCGNDFIVICQIKKPVELWRPSGFYSREPAEIRAEGVPAGNSGPILMPGTTLPAEVYARPINPEIQKARRTLASFGLLLA